MDALSGAIYRNTKAQSYRALKALLKHELYHPGCFLLSMNYTIWGCFSRLKTMNEVYLGLPPFHYTAQIGQIPILKLMIEEANDMINVAFNDIY